MGLSLNLDLSTRPRTNDINERSKQVIQAFNSQKTKSAAPSFDTDGFGASQDWKNDGSAGGSIIFMATSATPLGNYASSSVSGSKNFSHLNFGSGGGRVRNYQSKYRTQAL